MLDTERVTFIFNNHQDHSEAQTPCGPSNNACQELLSRLQLGKAVPQPEHPQVNVAAAQDDAHPLQTVMPAPKLLRQHCREAHRPTRLHHKLCSSRYEVAMGPMATQVMAKTRT